MSHLLRPGETSMLKELKEAADYVTSPIAEDGIYRACLHLGLLTD